MTGRSILTQFSSIFGAKLVYMNGLRRNWSCSDTSRTLWPFQASSSSTCGCRTGLAHCSSSCTAPHRLAATSHFSISMTGANTRNVLRVSLTIEDSTLVQGLLEELKSKYPLEILEYDTTGKHLDDTVFYIRFAQELRAIDRRHRGPVPAPAALGHQSYRAGTAQLGGRSQAGLQQRPADRKDHQGHDREGVLCRRSIPGYEGRSWPLLLPVALRGGASSRWYHRKRSCSWTPVMASTTMTWSICWRIMALAIRCSSVYIHQPCRRRSFRRGRTLRCRGVRASRDRGYRGKVEPGIRFEATIFGVGRGLYTAHKYVLQFPTTIKIQSLRRRSRNTRTVPHRCP